jgi:hypothetical protein
MASRRISLPVQVAIAAGLAFAGTLGLAASGASFSDLKSVIPSANCKIKGNISVSGERIYHVPGQRYYSATEINPLSGERWFCSEADARAAGWRISRV